MVKKAKILLIFEFGSGAKVLRFWRGNVSRSHFNILGDFIGLLTYTYTLLFAFPFQLFDLSTRLSTWKTLFATEGSSIWIYVELSHVLLHFFWPHSTCCDRHCASHPRPLYAKCESRLRNVTHVEFLTPARSHACVGFSSWCWGCTRSPPSDAGFLGDFSGWFSCNFLFL